LWSQHHDTEILNCNAVVNAMTLHRTEYDWYVKKNATYTRSRSNRDTLTEKKTKKTAYRKEIQVLSIQNKNAWAKAKHNVHLHALIFKSNIVCMAYRTPEKACWSPQ